MKDDVMKALLAGFVLLSMVICAIVIGSRKSPLPKLTAPIPVAPELEPDPLIPPIEKSKDKEEKTFTPSFIRGYHDGYSGAWLSPAKWMIVGEYRAGWNAGKQDKTAGKPNRFTK